MAKYTRRIKPKRIVHRTITHNPFLNPRPSVGTSTQSTPDTKKQVDSFEAEYEKFINELKAKKEAEKSNVEETPVVEETTPVVEDKVEETPVVEEPKPKKTRKKKEVVVEEEETDISEEPVNEVPEQTETTEA